MRTIRALTVAAAFFAVLPTIAVAQSARPFKDSWFWGLKGGGFTLADSGGRYVQRPTAGIDWLITRSIGGVYVSGSQTFFTEHAFTLRDPFFPVDSGLRTITLRNLRRLDVALMGFPLDNRRFHPYAGIGLSVQQVGSAVAEGPFFSVDQLNFAVAIIQEQRVAVSPFFIGGGQYRFNDFSIFGQISASPAQRSFIAFNGRSGFFAYEAGLRYNFGSSIAKDY